MSEILLFLLFSVFLAGSGVASVKYGFQGFGTFLLFCAFLTALAWAARIEVSSVT